MSTTTIRLPKEFDTTVQWVKTDAWRGYEKPLYAVFGWNDTGEYSDSPCPSTIGSREAVLAMQWLKSQEIPYMELCCSSSNIFCQHYYLIVPPNRYDEALALAKKWFKTVEDNTRLLYVG